MKKPEDILDDVFDGIAHIPDTAVDTIETGLDTIEVGCEVVESIFDWFIS
jgi:hypothetical protein